MKNKEKTIYQMKVESFAMCAMSVLEFYDVEAAIEHARKMGSDIMDSYQMEEGEKYFRNMLNENQ